MQTVVLPNYTTSGKLMLWDFHAAVPDKKPLTNTAVSRLQQNASMPINASIRMILYDYF